MHSLTESVNSINVHIGPEGGFSEKEISLASENDHVVLGLGKRILRAETASVVSLALLQSRYGDIQSYLEHPIADGRDSLFK